jgi:hypothetical protein
MPPPGPVPLTFEEHRELGRELRTTSARMHELSRLVLGVYGPHHRVSFSFQKSVEAIDRLCKELQTQAKQDLPEYPVEGFYG